MNVLVSTISFIDFDKPGADIYATFANRLVNDVLSKTPYDVRVNTNARELFEEQVNKNPDRVSIYYDPLDTHSVKLKAFNQLLKFFAIKDIDEKYDYVLYLDCDAGFINTVNPEVVDNYISEFEKQGYDMCATRTNATYKEELERFRNKIDSIFNPKFKYYGVDENLIGAVFPSEHILLLKNSEKLKKMCKVFEDFCFKFEEQLETGIFLTEDMEAFEIGVSAFKAGYKPFDMSNYAHHHILCVGFNSNNWENVKL